MNLPKFFLILLVFTASLQVCLGQNQTKIVEEENWLREYGIYPYPPTIFFRYDRYSKEDTVRFREKLDLLKEAKFSDEWEGRYYIGYEEEVGHWETRFDFNIGFVDFNISTCLQELNYINYGKAINSADFIAFIPDFAPDSPRKPTSFRYVKIRWDDQHYLVEESSLLAFAEKAVGIYVAPADDSTENKTQWTNFLVKGDRFDEKGYLIEKKFTGFPEFPASYKKFQRSPIEAKIIFVGKRIIEKADVVGNDDGYFKNAVYQVTINAGKNKGVKIGMTFDISEIGEDFIITQVGSNNAVGKMIRSLDENKIEFCTDGDNNQIECPKIRPSMKVQTRIGYFFF